MFKALKNKINKAFRDDSGASLLELIIAVTILAIVTAPLLKTFVVSAKFNAKAKTMGIENDAVTSIYEKIKGVDASEIVTANSDGTVSNKQMNNLKKIFGADSVTFHSPATIRPSADGIYQQVCSGVNLDIKNLYAGDNPASDRKFDANVEMTAVPAGSDGLISISEYTNSDVTTDNNKARAVQMSFDNVWMQPTDSTDPDDIVNSYLPKKINSDSTVSEDTIDQTPDAKRQKVLKNQRNITIKLETSKSSDGQIRVTPVVTYRYDIRWREYKNGTIVTKRIYANGDSDTKPADSEAIALYTRRLSEFTYQEAGKTDHHLFDVMVFYKPYYNAIRTDDGMYDTIDIENDDNLEGDIFIVKEEPDDSKTYSGIIRLMENHPSDPTHFNLRVHTNMGLAETDDMLDNKKSLSGGIFQLVKIYNSSGYYNLSDDLRNTDRNFSVTSLIKEEAIDHIYKVTIKLYESGGIAAGKQPVCTFNGIKVD